MNDVSLYRCLANPTRLAVLKQLRDGGEFCVPDFVGFAPTDHVNLTHHLAELRACGLVTTRQDGAKTCYRVASPRLRTILELAEAFSPHVVCTDATACLVAGCCD